MVFSSCQHFWVAGTKIENPCSSAFKISFIFFKAIYELKETKFLMFKTRVGVVTIFILAIFVLLLAILLFSYIVANAVLCFISKISPASFVGFPCSYIKRIKLRRFSLVVMEYIVYFPGKELLRTKMLTLFILLFCIKLYFIDLYVEKQHRIH